MSDTDKVNDPDDLEEFFSSAAGSDPSAGGDREPADPSPADPSQPPLPPHRRRKAEHALRKGEARAMARGEGAKRRKKKAIRRFFTVLIALLLVAAVAFTGSVIARGILKARQTAPEASPVRDCSDFSGPGGASTAFTVAPGESSSQVGQKLTKAGIVKTSCAFDNAMSSIGTNKTVQPGTFDLKKEMKASDAATILADPSKAKAILNIVAGDRISDVATKAAAASSLSKEDFQKALKSDGKGLLPEEAGGSFEGWLQPGTYDIRNASSATEILKTLVTARIKHLDKLGVPTGSEREVILKKASIAEAEADRSEYYSQVVEVINNRLAKKMTLGMDAINAYGFNEKGTDLTAAQLKDASNPYNSRIHQGLPPTPIGSPGDEALKAAMNPAKGDLLYFVTVNLDTGETKFTADKDEFAKYSQELQDWLKAHPQSTAPSSR
ncbi:hypothetical protein A200_04967 [Parascardovia denticolens IPLA 20019]|uniref:endolytic transglycosylase MltG n=1 Tax=Parascardovia denticolens TaxID=78258 RepID=UPI000266983F|nr:endolytic transglycosylase MltG [Parascardovia denticolens]EIT87906.1 hypothetical protein A200_04967 [Parascardovia denticolens IPLA 20019]